MGLSKAYRMMLLAGCAATAMASGAQAQDARSEGIVLDELTVVPGKVEQAPIDTPASVSVVDENEIARRQAETLAEVFQGMPGVVAVQDNDQPGATINIRGLQDFGRVAVIVDGARQNFQISKHGGQNPIFIEPDLLKAVTVVRGPVANIYGSGAIGGVVVFETLDARDILLPGETSAGILKGGYETNGDGWFLRGTGALRYGEDFDTTASVVYRSRGDYKDGAGNTVQDSHFDVLGGLAKASWRPADGHEFKVGYVGDETKWVDNEGTARKSRVVNNTGTLRYTFDDPDGDLWNLSATGYITETDLDQRDLTGSIVGNERSYRLITKGTDVYNTSYFHTGFMSHALTIGGDFFNDDVTTKDQGGSGALFTPGGKRDAYGAFIQDQIGLTSWLEVIGALRYDGYKLEGVDTITGEDVDNSDDRLSPKVTVAIRPFEPAGFDGFQVYGTYAEGYRAPSVTETLISGIHPFPQFPFLPNPDLKPEIGKTFEIGINFKLNDLFTDGDALRIKTAVFQNDVTDLISIEQVSAFPIPFGSYQYINVAKARIKGFEFESIYDAGWIFGGLAGHILRGKDRDTNDWLNSVPPDQLSATLGFRFLEEALEVGTTVNALAAQKRVNDPDLETDAYTLVDLFAGYQYNERLRFDVRFNNILDENYRPFLDLDNGPGFNTKFAMTMRF